MNINPALLPLIGSVLPAHVPWLSRDTGLTSIEDHTNEFPSSSVSVRRC